MINRGGDSDSREMQWQESTQVPSKEYSKSIGMNLKRGIGLMTRSGTKGWCRRCWVVGRKRGGTVSTGALIVGRIYGGFVSPARVAFACPALRNTRMIL